MSTDLFDLTGSNALVTGSGSGIGFAIAGGFGRAGATVVLNGRNAARLDEAADKLRGEGTTVHTAPFDVTDPEAVAAAVADIEERVGPIGIVVNNAGIQIRAPLDAFAYEDWRKMLSTHLDGAFLVGRAVAQRMIPRKAGKIINICSVTSELGRATIAPYAAAKGGLKMLTRGMATDWARHGIQANGIAPGYFRTELNRALWEDDAFNDWIRTRTPAGRWGEVEELTGAAIFLASPASNFVSGHILFVDGGFTASM